MFHDTGAHSSKNLAIIQQKRASLLLFFLDNVRSSPLLCRAENGGLYRSCRKGDCGATGNDVPGGVDEQTCRPGAYFREIEEELHQAHGWGYREDGDEPAGSSEGPHNIPYEERQCRYSEESADT